MLADLRDNMRRCCVRIMLTALATLVATIGLVMLVVSAYLYLAESLSAPAAAAVTGGIVLLLAGLIALAARRLGRSTSRKPVRETAAPGPPIKDSALGIVELLGAAEAAVRADARSVNPRFALMALLTGCAIGASPRLRRAIADLAR